MSTVTLEVFVDSIFGAAVTARSSVRQMYFKHQFNKKKTYKNDIRTFVAIRRSKVILAKSKIFANPDKFVAGLVNTV